jgi:alpha-amylase
MRSCTASSARANLGGRKTLTIVRAMPTTCGCLISNVCTASLLSLTSYSMGNDLDYSQPDVRADVTAWGSWITERLNLAGFRLDAVKHFSSGFLRDWIAKLDERNAAKAGARPLLMVGEYWRADISVLGAMIQKFEGRLRLFDVPLAANMSRLSIAREKGDLRTILPRTLLERHPRQAVVRVAR